MAAGVLSAAPAANAADVFSAGAVRVLAGGEVSASIAKKDRGYFNTQEYYENVLRLFRVRLTSEVRVGERVAVLGELRHANDRSPSLYAAYLRVHPFRDVPVDVQAGRIPPVFGAYPRRAYAADSPLIGAPLAYQYLTALGAEFAPMKTDEIIAARGRGGMPRYQYTSSYDTTSYTTLTGLPVVNSLRWDTGAQLRVATEKVEVAAAVTQGSPANPRVRDDNDGNGVAGRVAWMPTIGLILGGSVARGRYLSSAAETAAGRGGRTQQVMGADAEYSRGRFLVRAEGVRATWDLPVGDRAVPDEPLSAWSGMVEGRVKVAPGVSVAGRVDRLAFGDVPAYGTNVPWEFAMTRLESAVAWTPHRYALVKLAYQHNRRSGGYVRRQSFVAGQLVVWF